MRVGISGDRDATPERAAATRARDAARWPAPNLSAEVSTAEPYVVPAVGEKRFTVAALDLGIKANDPAMMAERGIEVHVLPATATARRRAARSTRTAFLLQRPRRPGRHRPPGRAAAGRAGARAAATSASASATSCSGARSGFGTYKLTYGHRGINQPVHGPHHRQGRDHRAQPRLRRRRPARRATIDTPYGEREVSHVCLNDDVVEGLSCLDGQRRFSVQYHPEAAAGPHDAGYLFDRFVDLMDRRRADA